MGRLTAHGSVKVRNRIPALRPLSAVLAAATLCALLPTMPAGAVTTPPPTNPMQVISAPPSAQLNKLTSATLIREWDEQQRVTLGTALGVDLVAGGTYTKTSQVPAAGSVSIPAGTVVDSHLIHADAPGKQTEIRGTITYAQPIVGVIIKSANLDKTDAVFGATGTVYQKNHALRGLELSPDVLIFSGNTLELRSTTYDAWDEVRVFTRSAPLLTATTLSQDRATVGAGVSTVPVSDIPSSALTASSDPNATAAASFSSAQLSSTALKRVDIASSTLGSIALKRVALEAGRRRGSPAPHHPAVRDSRLRWLGSAARRDPLRVRPAADDHAGRRHRPAPGCGPHVVAARSQLHDPRRDPGRCVGPRLVAAG